MDNTCEKTSSLMSKSFVQYGMPTNFLRECNISETTYNGSVISKIINIDINSLENSMLAALWL